MSDSEQMGRCRQQLEAWYANNSSSVPRYSWMVADAIDRLAEDVAAIKAKADAISPEDVAHFVESEKAWVRLVEEKETAAIRERDEARAEVERLKNELYDREQEILSLRADTVERYEPHAAPQPAAPPPGWLTEEERELLQSRLHALRVYLRSLCKPAPGSVTREVEIIDALLARAGSWIEKAHGTAAGGTAAGWEEVTNG